MDRGTTNHGTEWVIWLTIYGIHCCLLPSGIRSMSSSIHSNCYDIRRPYRIALPKGQIENVNSILWINFSLDESVNATLNMPSDLQIENLIYGIISLVLLLCVLLGLLSLHYCSNFVSIPTTSIRFEFPWLQVFDWVITMQNKPTTKQSIEAILSIEMSYM